MELAANTGICSEVNHTAFHSSVYMLAFDAVAEENKLSTWSYIKSRIDPPFSTSSSDPAVSNAAHSDPSLWPPPPPAGEHVRTLSMVLLLTSGRQLSLVDLTER